MKGQILIKGAGWLGIVLCFLSALQSLDTQFVFAFLGFLAGLVALASMLNKCAEAENNLASIGIVRPLSRFLPVVFGCIFYVVIVVQCSKYQNWIALNLLPQGVLRTKAGDIMSLLAACLIGPFISYSAFFKWFNE
jgi:hypothetical protein